jgi:hypothetical protein
MNGVISHFSLASAIVTVLKEGVYYDFHKIFQAKLNKICLTVFKYSENIKEVEQISLLTTCITKLHTYYRVTLHILDFH